METNKIKEIIMQKENLKEDDYFNSTIFYYLSGRFPKLTIKECVDIVDQIRNDIIEKYTYSKSLDDLVIKSFTFKKKHYTWHDDDCVYYNDDTDEEWFSEVPENAIIE